MSGNSKKKIKGIKITGCMDPLMWYVDKIGETVPFVYEEDNCFMSREPDGYLNIVLKKDAEIVYT